MKTLTKLAIALTLMTVTAQADELQAPLGLTWGMTKAEAESSGMKFHNCAKLEVANRCKTFNPPKPVTFGAYYTLHFFPDHGLQSLVVGGQLHGAPDDFSRRKKAKEFYVGIKTRLARKYGMPVLDDEYYTFGEEWRAFWVLSDGSVYLSPGRCGKYDDACVFIGYSTDKAVELSNSTETSPQDDDAL